MLAQHTLLLSTILLTVVETVFRFSDVLATPKAWIKIKVENRVPSLVPPASEYLVFSLTFHNQYGSEATSD
jgi:hypothetical protein